MIGEIFIAGNRKTKTYIIERELPFKRGDSVRLAELVKAFEYARDRLINTRLFVDVVISLKRFPGIYCGYPNRREGKMVYFPAFLM